MNEPLEEPPGVFYRALRSVLRNGPVTSTRWGWYHLDERVSDRRLGIQTDRRPEFTHLDDYGAESVRYEPLPYALVRTALAAVVRPATVQRDVFLDYGAGLGRVVIMAARHPFKRVQGVELLDRLSQLAASNLRAAGPRLKAPAEVLTRDARHYEVPDDVSIICLFNPFTGQVMADVQRRIEASLRRSPRPLTVLYAHPDDQENLFARCRWLGVPRRLPVGVFDRLKLLRYQARLS